MMAGMRSLREETWSYKTICRDAIKIEREVLGESGGVQDQVAASYPGFNIINLSDRGMECVTYNDDFLDLIVDRCVLFYLGRERKSFKIAQEYNKAEALDNQHRIREIAEDGYDAIMRGDYELLRDAVDESWNEKRRISPLISTPEVDSYVGQIRDLGGATKLMGSGGAGFIMTLLPESADKVEFTQSIKLHAVDVGLDTEGVTIL
jgi:D-glycero-alpha-D-manno-heptose-7-phosphate kinase